MRLSVAAMRIVLVWLILIATLGVWDFYFLAYFHAFEESLYVQGRPVPELAGNLIDFTLGLQDQFKFWTGLCMIMSALEGWFSLKGQIHNRLWRRCMICFWSLLLLGTFALSVAKILFERAVAAGT